MTLRRRTTLINRMHALTHQSRKLITRTFIFQNGNRRNDIFLLNEHFIKHEPRKAYNFAFPMLNSMNNIPRKKMVTVASTCKYIPRIQVWNVEALGFFIV